MCIRDRAIDTISAHPSAKISSATSGVLIRLTAISGTETSDFNFLVTQAKAFLGTIVAMVGIRACLLYTSRCV